MLGGSVFRYVAFLDKIHETLFDKMHEYPFVLGRWERAPPLPYCGTELPVARRALGWWVVLNAESRKALQQIDFASTLDVGWQSQIKHRFSSLQATL